MFSQRWLCNGKEVGIGACKMWSYKAAIPVSFPGSRGCGARVEGGGRGDLFVSKDRSIPELRVGFKFCTRAAFCTYPSPLLDEMPLYNSKLKCVSQMFWIQKFRTAGRRASLIVFGIETPS